MGKSRTFLILRVAEPRGLQVQGSCVLMGLAGSGGTHQGVEGVICLRLWQDFVCLLSLPEKNHGLHHILHRLGCIVAADRHRIGAKACL